MKQASTIIIANCEHWFYLNQTTVGNDLLDIRSVETPENLIKASAKFDSRTIIFFPHWRWLIPEEIYRSHLCIGFHIGCLPQHRGGSPVQNLILRGYSDSDLCSFLIGGELDAGDILLRDKLSLDGCLTEIFARANSIVNSQIQEIMTSFPTPQKQVGVVSEFKRRTPQQSKINENSSLAEIYDAIRMLDYGDYPRAFLENGNSRIEFSDASLDAHAVTAKAVFSSNIETQLQTIPNLLTDSGAIEFVEVERENDKHWSMLYSIFMSRESNQRISSDGVLPYNEHVSFVTMHPYRAWHILMLNEQPIGQFYVTYENVLSLVLFPKLQSISGEVLKYLHKEIKPLKGIKSIRPSKLVVNVSSDDKDMIKHFEETGFQKIQHTFVLN